MQLAQHRTPEHVVISTNVNRKHGGAGVEIGHRSDCMPHAICACPGRHCELKWCTHLFNLRDVLSGQTLRHTVPVAIPRINFPDRGHGSQREELHELVTYIRKEMVQHLFSKTRTKLGQNCKNGATAITCRILSPNISCIQCLRKKRFRKQ